MINLKQKIAIGIISVLLIGTIIFAAIYDSYINDCVLEVNGIKYSDEDFEKFLRMVEYENDSAYSEAGVDIEDTFGKYADMKVLLQEANKHGVTLTEEEKKSIQEAYDSEDMDKEKLSIYGISREDFIKVCEESSLATKYEGVMGQYHYLSEEDYQLNRAQFSDGFKMYSYRIMQVIPEKAEGEEDKPITEEDRQLAKTRAAEALEKVKNGEDFEKVAEEYGSLRITQNLAGQYNVINGALETLPLLYMNQDLPINKAIINAKAGEYTEIIYDNDSYSFAKVESVEEGLSEEAEAKVRSDLNNQYANEYIKANTVIVKNLSKAKKIKLTERREVVNNEANNLTETEENNEGENLETTENVEFTEENNTVVAE